MMNKYLGDPLALGLHESYAEIMIQEISLIMRSHYLEIRELSDSTITFETENLGRVSLLLNL